VAYIHNLSGLHENRPLHLHAVEPGNLVCSYWRSIRIVPIDYQSKRRDVYTAAQRRRCDVVVAWRIFRWEGEPQRKLQKTRLPRLDLGHQSHLYIEKQLESRHLYPASPLPPIRIPTQPDDRTSRMRRPTSHVHTATERAVHGDRINRIRPRRPVMSLSFPTLPDSLDLPARHFVFLYTFGWGCA